MVRSTLREAVPPNYVVIREEFDSMTKEDHEGAFTIGSIRNPCDYYVSLWAFGSETKKMNRYADFAALAFDPNISNYLGVSDSLNTTEDLQRFSHWLRYLMPTCNPGLESARLAFGYAEATHTYVGLERSLTHRPSVESVATHTYGFKLPAELRHMHHNATLRNLLQDSIDAFDTASVDCWVKAENLEDDLKRCLYAYEESVGATVVDWANFTRAMSVKKNSSPHQPCAFYYNDANKAFVTSADQATFEKFGYDTCCAPSHA
jgi:hypothetical protein